MIKVIYYDKKFYNRAYAEEFFMQKMSRKYIFSILIIYPIFLLVIFVILYKAGILHSFKRFIVKEKNEFIFQNYSAVDKLKIEIKKKDLLMMNFTAAKAVEEYSIKFIQNPYYKARILFKGKYIPVNIRLKGATANEHLKGKKKSFRLKILGENSLLGMTEFSLMDPARRNYLYEWIIRRIFLDEDLLSKKYEFVQLTINDENLGLYVIDEKPSKLVIERNADREGIIVRFNDDAFWFDKIAYTVLGNNISEAWQEYYYSAPIEPLNKKKIENNKELLQQFFVARKLLEDFRSNKILASQVFDISKMAKFYAVSTAVGANHGALIFNMDFYFNPLTSLLEPILDDSYSEVNFSLGPINKYAYRYWLDDFSKQLFRDKNFFKAYFKEFERLSEDSYFKNFLKKHSEELENLENLFKFFYPGFPDMDQLVNGEIKALVDSLKKAHNPHLLLRAIKKNIDNDKITLDISLAHNNFPVEILGIEHKGEIVAETKQNVIYPDDIYYAKPKLFETFSFLKNSNFPEKIDLKNNSEFYLIHKILGGKKIKKVEINLNQNYLENKIFNKKLSSTKLKEFEFLLVDENKKIITFKNRTQKLEKDLFIPKGYTLKLDSGTKITLIDGSSIFSKSNILINGNKESPIIIETRKNKNHLNFGGIYILNTTKKSYINYAIFKNLGNYFNGTNQFTGSITFYNSDVKILNSKFTNNHSEDSLNIIKSKFMIGNSLFDNSQSDAVDIDFSEGKIINTKILNSSNDGLDFSGSHVAIENIFISKSGDKGISIGEKSLIEGKNITIKESGIGIATKDSSNAKISGATIENNDIGVATYKKKKEFSNATIVFSNSIIENNKKNFLSQNKSDIIR